MPLRDVLLALCVSIVWGLNFTAMKWGVDEMSPLLLTALRFAGAALPAVFFVRRPQVGLGLLVGFGLAIGVGQFGLLHLAIKFGMPAGLSSLVIQLQAFFTIGLAMVLLGERPGPFQLGGAALAFAGIGAIALGRAEGAALVPLLMTVLAALFWGVGNIVTKLAGRIDMLSWVVWASLVPVLPLLLLSLLVDGPAAIPDALARITWLGGFSLAFMAYGATIFGYGVWSMLLSRHPASRVVPFSLLVPVAGMAGAGLLLGETIGPAEIAGSALVFCGLVLNLFGGWFWRRLRPRQA